MGGRKRKNHKKLREDREESIAFPGGVATRSGRFIQIEKSSSFEQADFLRSYASAVKLRAEGREALHERLLSLLCEVGPFDLIARASILYLAKDLSTYKEWEDDRLAAHIEYLALQAVGVKCATFPANMDPVQAAVATFEAISIVRQLFEIAQSRLVADEMEKFLEVGVVDPASEYSMLSRLHSMAVRNPAYGEHAESVIRDCLSPEVLGELAPLIGFTGSDALHLIHAIPRLVNIRLEPLQKWARETERVLITQLKRERRGRSTENWFPDWLLKMPFDAAAGHTAFIASATMLADAEGAITFTAAELSEASEVPLQACEAFLSVLTCSPRSYSEQHHKFPVGVHPVTTNPILNVGGRYMVPGEASLIDAVRPRAEDVIAKAVADKSVSSKSWDRFQKRRADYLERASVELLCSNLPGSAGWVAVNWHSATQFGELDGLVTSDILGLRLQCKAGRVHDSTRRGGPGKMATDLGKLLTDAERQHETLANALDAHAPTALGFNDEQADALSQPIQVEMIVTLDDLTVWSTEAHKLTRTGILGGRRRTPWIISLTDLMAVTDLLQGAQLALYILRRQRLEAIGRISAHDELDWVGHFIFEGLYFEDMEEEGGPDALKLLSYTEKIDTWYFGRAGTLNKPVPRPERHVPEPLSILVRRLEQARPKHWLAAALILLNGDQEVMAMWERSIKHVYNRSREIGWSTATQVYNMRYGVSFLVLRSPLFSPVRQQVEDYSRRGPEKYGPPNWIAIYEDSSGRLGIVTAGAGGIADIARRIWEPVRPDSVAATDKSDEHP